MIYSIAGVSILEKNFELLAAILVVILSYRVDFLYFLYITFRNRVSTKVRRARKRLMFCVSAENFGKKKNVRNW